MKGFQGLYHEVLIIGCVLCRLLWRVWTTGRLHGGDGFAQRCEGSVIQASFCKLVFKCLRSNSHEPGYEPSQGLFHIKVDVANSRSLIINVSTSLFWIHWISFVITQVLQCMMCSNGTLTTNFSFEIFFSSDMKRSLYIISIMLHMQPGDESYEQFAQERDAILSSLARRAEV